LITLSLPSDNEKVFCLIQGSLVGPFRLDGTSPGDSITFRSKFDTLEQSRGRFHENNVAHLQVEGEVNYSPVLKEVTSAAEVDFPFRVNWRGKRLSDNGIYGFTADMGLALTDSYSYRQYGSYFTHHVIRYISRTQFESLRIAANRYNPGAAPFVYRDVYTLTSCTKDNTIFDLRYSSKSSGTGTSANLIKPLSFGEVQDFVMDQLSSMVLIPSTYYNGGTYVSQAQASLSVEEARGVIDAFVRDQLIDVASPLLLEDYGNLALEASQKVNANRVNMIAFLRDLRNPKDMIPKLKNLSRLKTHAGNFLAVNYGVLPTISDIQAIAESFKRIAPYLDRNGFSTYSTVRNQTAVVDDITHTSEQRIKIAIENEDSSMLALANKLESSGFAPTLQNIWDLIPYSFVIDWFVDIGDFLERIDSRLRLARLNIRYATMSHRSESEKSFSSTQSSLIGNLKVVRYQRWTSDQCPVPPLSLSSTPTVTNHWLEAGALIIQRAKYIK
jgi:hypothetical protein